MVIAVILVLPYITGNSTRDKDPIFRDKTFPLHCGTSKVFAQYPPPYMTGNLKPGLIKSIKSGTHFAPEEFRLF